MSKPYSYSQDPDLLMILKAEPSKSLPDFTPQERQIGEDILRRAGVLEDESDPSLCAILEATIIEMKERGILELPADGSAKLIELMRVGGLARFAVLLHVAKLNERRRFQDYSK